jgi:membrane-bound lytic murein transglycosylase D
LKFSPPCARGKTVLNSDDESASEADRSDEMLNRVSWCGLTALAFCWLAACSHTPSQPQIVEATTEPSANPSISPVAEAPESSLVLSENTEIDPSATEDVEPAEPKTAEEAVAIAVAEQNLLDRIRAGFAMSDAEHATVDREVAWFARHDEYLDRTFRRAERYLFFIVEELEARKMPLELALLPIVESAFIPTALSRARAAGLWQFIPSTGKRYGLEQNHSYDGRRDVVESTRAALDYLQFLANEFDGDWHLAVAAYNSGEYNVARAIARNRSKGRPTDFFSLDLPRETRAYVPKLLAMRRIVAQPENYGLEFGHIANQPYFAKVELDAPIDLAVAAQLAGLPTEDMIALNPAHQRAVASSDHADFLLVPVDRAEQLRAGLAAMQSPHERVPKIYYTVHRGDTVSSIARKLGVSQAELVAANRIKKNTLRIGQELVITRGASRASAVAATAATTTTLQRVVTRDPNYVPPPLPPREPRAYEPTDRHKVREGETLWSVARKYGVSLNALASENKLSANARLAKGQKLWIPGRETQTARKTEASTLVASTTNPPTVQKITYVVRTGDTLMRIAKAFRVQIKDLLEWNKLSAANAIRAGQKLVMYVDDARRSGG